ncbi:spinster family MFS transporter [Sphingobium fuliginis]|uniref:Major facilitator family transporter n=1 Tax=Sphingobium fuliginis (strain ATCC 27551) TaxID=336203 RepID=A0A292ZIR9_SPHSA|nr:MFS transporter [Sphingobium fuliginis]GAY22811.1 major facilitator family transporter [Sphingobium fuliginis]
MTQPQRPPRTNPSDAALLAILSLVYGAQYLDQILLGMFIKPIKAEFALSDTQIGLLTGVAFTALFVILGLPMARLADRGSRKLIVLGCATIFSLATIFCGLSVGFLSLFAMRMLVAVGEAGTIPASVSMLADVFPPSKRRLAMSFHSCGAYFGTSLGLLFIALATDVLSWRHIFAIAGAFGLILALLVAVFVREPKRVGGAAAPATFMQDLRKLIVIKPFVFLSLALGVMSIATSAAINWVPAFLGRSHGMSQQQIVLFLAAVWGLGATTGGVISGVVTNRLYRMGGRWPLLVVGCLMIFYPAMCSVAFLAADASITMIGFGFALFVMGGIRGPSFATVQDIAPAHCRATANAILMFSMYAIGVSLGPLLTGIISDILNASFGAESLRYALLAVIASAGVLAATLVGLAALTMKDAVNDEGQPA